MTANTSKPLRELLYKAGIAEIIGSADVLVPSVCFSTAQVSEGCMFVAVKGSQTDGHKFIRQAIENGASVIICENIPAKRNDNVTYVRVNNSAVALAYISANFFDHPSEKLKLVGITGTNGKTTTASLLYQVFRMMGHKAGLISTVNICINDSVTAATHTTPDVLSLNALLKCMLDEGCTHCFMEVSSHAVVQQRIAGLQFAGGIFTNITHDHLDYHKTFEAYLKAKKSFFDQLPEPAFTLVNADDRNSKIMVQNTRAQKKTYGLRSMSNFRCKVVENTFSGLLLNIDGNEVFCKLIGSFNAYNLLAVYGTAILLGADKLKVLTALSDLNPVEGRFEYIVSQNHVTGIVDYAHTPDALQNVLKTINDIRTGNEKVITIIGCGGDRDQSKRPVMARIACELSDKVILTSDNPRSEDPFDILSQMQKGVPAEHFRKSITIVDRKEAVKAACNMVQSGDIILLAGKGHEKYQEIKGVKYPFDDKDVLTQSFKIMES